MKYKKIKKVKKTRSNHKDGRGFRLGILIATIILLAVIVSQHKSLIALSKWGYLGVFIINFVSSSTVIFPLPGVASVFLGGALWNPVLIGIFSGLGASLGEVFGYLVGYGGRGLLKSWKDGNSWLKGVEDFFHKTGFVTTFIVSLLPIPIFDFIGILAGTLNYPLWKFFLATFLGRLIRNLIIAWSGSKVLPI